MTDSDTDSRVALRRGVYLILIAIGLGAVLGRILAVDAVDWTAVQADRAKRVDQDLERERKLLQATAVKGQELDDRLQQFKAKLLARPSLRRPFLSGNDRSRWCTVRALVEPEMRVEGAPYAIDKVIQQPNWDTIDMVKHDGHLYSSKPPLLPTLVAGEYWLDLSPHRRVAGHASVRNRPLHADHDQRGVSADLLSGAGRAGRAARHDRLGADFRHGGRRVRHFSDHVRRGAEQSPGGRGLHRGRLVLCCTDLVFGAGPRHSILSWPAFLPLSWRPTNFRRPLWPRH